ncbi:MAG: chemotaxis-specific protein-glutamate methyltransferase CheB [SAR324 cluster bacterium]|nr:chemotaxis-specific protein-glutamate methyltransferase CheB [SAR324 cluster bacterium]
MLNVLVVDDSLTIRKWIVETLEDDPRFKVVGEAVNGKEAIHLADKLRPDVITMDMMMPEMTGLSATEYIMAHCPTRILIVSASTNRGEVMKTYDALAAGAISVFEKPGNITLAGEEWSRQLIEEILLISRVPVIRHIKGTRILKQAPAPQPANHYKVVALGASTGGPQTLLGIFKKIPADFPLPILCVLHISPNFAHTIAEWFSMNCELDVKFAKGGEAINNGERGKVYMAPADYHLEIESGRLKLTRSEPVHFCRPSVDVLFQSVAKSYNDQAIAVLLTGMGRDGAAGMKSLYDAHGFTMAQNEESCVIFGMPAEAIKLGAAKQILSDADIPSELLLLSGYKK